MVQTEGVDRLFNLTIVRNNISYVFYPFARATWLYGGWGLLIIGGAISLWLLYKKVLNSRHLVAWGMLLMLVFSIPWLTATFRYLTPSKSPMSPRHGCRYRLVGVAYPIAQAITRLLARVRPTTNTPPAWFMARS